LVINDRKVTVIGIMPSPVRWFTAMALDAFTKNPPPERWSADCAAQARRHQCGSDGTAPSRRRRLQSEHPNDFPKNSSVLVHFNNYMDITVASGDMRNSLTLLFGAGGIPTVDRGARTSQFADGPGYLAAREIALRMSIGHRADEYCAVANGKYAPLDHGGLWALAVAIALTKPCRDHAGVLRAQRSAHHGEHVRCLDSRRRFSIATAFCSGWYPRCNARGRIWWRSESTGKGSGDSSAGGRTRGALVIIEVALSVVLLVGRGLTIVDSSICSESSWVQSRHTLMVNVQVNPKKYSTYDRSQSDARGFGAREDPAGSSVSGDRQRWVPFGGMRSTFAIDGAIDGKLTDDSKFLFGSMVSTDTPGRWASPSGRREISEQEIAHAITLE